MNDPITCKTQFILNDLKNYMKRRQESIPTMLEVRNTQHMDKQCS